MTRRDYRQLALAINRLWQGIEASAQPSRMTDLFYLIEEFSEIAQRQNPRFSKAKFRDACLAAPIKSKGQPND